MKTRTLVILERAVEEGIEYGIRRAHKHTDAPSEDAIARAVEESVMGAIHEAFVFDDEEGYCV